MININHLTNDELHAFCAKGLDDCTNADLVCLVESLLGRLSKSSELLKKYIERDEFEHEYTSDDRKYI